MFHPVVRLQKVLVVLLTTGLSCQYSSRVVTTAFIRSPLPVSISATKIPLSSGSSGGYVNDNDHQDDQDVAHQLLLDESVLLYSQVSRRTNFDDNTEVENDILTLRKNELSSLIEDVVFEARRGIEGDVVIEAQIIIKGGDDDFSANNQDENDKEEKETEFLDGISRALDQQILIGYQSTYTEEELEQWVGRIDSLSEKLQSQLAALPPASSSSASISTVATSTTDTSTITTVKTTASPLDQLHVRLECMRTLIDPEGNGRLRLPLARPVIKAQNNAQRKIVKPENTTNPIVGASKSDNKATRDKPGTLIPSSSTNSSSSNSPMTETTATETETPSTSNTTTQNANRNTPYKKKYFSPKYNSIFPPKMSSNKRKNSDALSSSSGDDAVEAVAAADQSTNTTTTKTATNSIATNVVTTSTSNSSNFTSFFSSILSRMRKVD